MPPVHVGGFFMLTFFWRVYFKIESSYPFPTRLNLRGLFSIMQSNYRPLFITGRFFHPGCKIHLYILEIFTIGFFQSLLYEDSPKLTPEEEKKLFDYFRDDLVSDDWEIGEMLITSHSDYGKLDKGGIITIL